MKRIALPFLLASAFAVLNAFATETVNLAIGEWPPYTSETDARGNFLEKENGTDLFIEHHWLRNKSVPFSFGFGDL